jgi:hypothetical protein
MEEKTLVCPHCDGTHLSTGHLPKEVVAVVPCPACQGLCVTFREKVVPLDKTLLKSGTRRQRILHIAEIITEFVDSGVVPEANSILLGDNLALFEGEESAPHAEAARAHEHTAKPVSITDEEYLQFQQVELRSIDNAAFFRRTFG